MVEKYGTPNYNPNQVTTDDYDSIASAYLASMGHEKRGGVGGKGSKSHNFIENKNMKAR